MASPKLRILFLGASLVAGFSSGGDLYHPFSHTVVKTLERLLPGVQIEAVVDGIPGDFVTRGRFLERMQSHFGEGQERFDWTVVLGGTNDVANSVKSDKILASFKELWAVPLAHGSRVLALTIPGATVDRRNASLVARRNTLNAIIKDYRADNFYVFDLHDAVPCDEEHEQYWDDVIHFTPQGYDYIGDKVGAALTKIILGEKRTTESA